MLSCLLACLALGAASTSAEPPGETQGLRCDHVKTLEGLDLEKVAGDWLVLGSTLFSHAGVPQPPPAVPTPASGPAPSACMHLRLAVGPEVTGTLNAHFGPYTKSEPLHYRATPGEPGRLVDQTNSTIELLVTSGDPERYLVTLECHPYLSEGDRAPRAGMILSRYDAASGTPALSPEQLETVVVGVREALGAPDLRPMLLDNQCHLRYQEA